MKLKEMRLARGFKSKEIAPMVGLDEANWSRIETYKLLPVPKTLTAICEIFECEVSDIYNKEEITFTHVAGKKPSGKSGYKVKISLPDCYRDTLRQLIKSLGYTNYTEWLMDYIKQTEKKSNAKH